MSKFYSLCLIMLFVIGGLAVNGVTATQQHEQNLINDDTEEHMIIDSTSTKYYSNGLVAPQGTSEIKTKSSNSTHPLTRNVTNIVPLEELVIMPPSVFGGCILDDSINNFTRVHEIERISSASDDRSQIHAGDVEGDGVDEVVIVEYIRYVGYGVSVCDRVDGEYQTSVLQIYLNNTFDWLDSVLGDFDGDGVDELGIALGFSAYSPLRFIEVCTWDISENKSLGTKIVPVKALAPLPVLMRMEAGDIDGDGADEYILTYNTGITLAPELSYLIALDDINSSLNTLFTVDGDLLFESYAQMIVGDFDGDFYDEIGLLVFAYNPSENLY
ncbi:MAG: hypothetical protein ACFFBD_26270, partial [Candidatus Hodarchaeota archaeon]